MNNEMTSEKNDRILDLEAENRLYRQSHMRYITLNALHQDLLAWLLERILEEKEGAAYDRSSYIEGRLAAYKDVYKHLGGEAEGYL